MSVLPDTPGVNCMHAGDFIICKIDGEDDYRIACFLDTGDNGEPAKWVARDGQDVSFTFEDLQDLARVIAMMPAPTIGNNPPHDPEGWEAALNKDTTS